MQSKYIHKVSFKVNDEGKEQLVEKIKSSGLKTSDFLRQLLSQSTVTAKMTVAEREAINTLKGVANNLNQLAKKANQNEDFLTLYASILNTKNLIDEFINHIYKR